jgi:predicted nucleic acid-binding protein
MSVDPNAAPYVDTSALAKRYLAEPFSNEVDAYLADFPGVAISTLTQVEMHCLLARRRRHREITAEDERRIRVALREDIDLGYFRASPIEDRHFQHALHLLDALEEHRLRTLDALHLGVVQATGLRNLATADVKMAEAARDLGLEVRLFA